MSNISYSSFSLNPLKNFSFKNFSWEKPVLTRVEAGQESKVLVIGAKTKTDTLGSKETEFIVAPNTFYGRTLWFLFGSSKQINEGINHLYYSSHQAIKPSFWSSPITLQQAHKRIEERHPDNRDQIIQ